MGTAWGQFTWDGARLRLTVEEGTLRLSRIVTPDREWTPKGEEARPHGGQTETLELTPKEHGGV